MAQTISLPERLCRVIIWTVAFSGCGSCWGQLGPLIPRRFHARPVLRSGIPHGQYQVTMDSRSVAAISQPAILSLPPSNFDVADRIQENSVRPQRESNSQGILPTPPSIDQRSEKTKAARRTKTFSFENGQLVVDHCSISHASVAVDDDGHWTLSLTAEQNGNLSTISPRSTGWKRQNEFVVTLRFYGQYRTRPIRIRGTALPQSRPILAQLGPIEFFVRNGQPFDLWLSGDQMTTANGTSSTRWQTNMRSGDPQGQLRRYFEQIDRVEIKFHYRGGEVVHPPTGSTVIPR